MQAWRAVAHDPEALSIPFIAGAYYNTRANARTASWRAANGPIAVAWLELKRLGWPWPTPVEFPDADGNIYQLVQFSPNTMRHLLHRATLDGLARRLAKAESPRRVL